MEGKCQTNLSAYFFLVIFCITLLCQGQALSGTKSDLEIANLEMTLIVTDVNSVQKKFLELIAESNGYLTRITHQLIILKIPLSLDLEKTTNLISGWGLIVSKNLNRQNIYEAIVDLKTLIKVKRQHIERLYTLFKNSDFLQTLDIEKSVYEAVLELEKQKGRLNFLQDQSSYITITVHFEYQVPQTQEIDLGIEWVKYLGLNNFIGSF